MLRLPQPAPPHSHPARMHTSRPPLLHCLPSPLPPHQVYDFAKAKMGRFGEADFNSTMLYNSSTYYDDLAWAAGEQDEGWFRVLHCALSSFAVGFVGWQQGAFPLGLLPVLTGVSMFPPNAGARLAHYVACIHWEGSWYAVFSLPPLRHLLSQAALQPDIPP